MKLTLANWNRIWGRDPEPAPMSDAGKLAVEAARKAATAQGELFAQRAAASPTNVAGPTTAVYNPYGDYGTGGWASGWERRNDLDEIAPYVFQGGALDYLPAGIDAVINVNGSTDTFPRWQPIQASLHMPIGDDAREAPSIEWLGTAVGAIERFRAQGWSVFIHCAMGISRSGMVSVAYVMKKDRLTVGDALAKVRKGRPCTHPNPGFLRALEAWQRHLGIVAKTETAKAAESAFAGTANAWYHEGAEGITQDEIDAADIRRSLTANGNANWINADATGKRVPCPTCGHEYVHAMICPQYVHGTGTPPPSGPTPSPAGENEEEEELLVGDGHGDAKHCGACGRESLVIAGFEGANWCPDCLVEEDEHREVLADLPEAEVVA